MQENTTKQAASRDNIEERYNALFHNSLDCIFINDLSGKFIDANHAFLRLSGYSLDELRSMNISDMLVYNDKAFIENVIEEIKQSGIQANSRQIRLKSKDERSVDIETRSSVLCSKGEPYALQTLARDVTERCQQERIQQSLFKISEAVNTTADLQELFDSVHQIIKTLMPANNFYIALYDPIRDLISFPYFVDEYDEAPTEPIKPGRGLTEYVIRTGRDMLVNEAQDKAMRESGEVDLVGESSKVWLGVALKVMDNTIGVMVVQDYHNENAYGETEKQLLVFVSEQIAFAIDKKRAEEELIRFTEEVQYSRDLLEERAAEFVRLNEQLAASEDELKEVIASKDKFFSIIAHDLRSPFSGLLGFSNMLLEDFDNLSKDDIKNFTKHINAYTKNLFNLIENLLQWARVQTGRMEYQPIKLDIHEIINDTLSLLMVNALKKNITLKSTLNECIHVLGDQNMLRSVLHNLVSNSLKFTNPEGSVTVSVENKDEDFVEVSVSDNGVGIRQEDLAKLFRIDTTHSTLGTAQEKGTGLGLVLCKDLIVKHGGDIRAESTFGQGTTFRFTIKKFK